MSVIYNYNYYEEFNIRKFQSKFTLESVKSTDNGISDNENIIKELNSESN